MQISSAAVAKSEKNFNEILSADALEFVAKISRKFESRRQELLAARVARAKRLEAGEKPDFLKETANVRQSDWMVAKLPKDLECRRVEITGPVERKMVINALNSGADSYMTDFEDSNTPNWQNQIQGQINLRDAIRRQIDFESGGKQYRLNEKTATLLVRPRGWHLDEKHLRVDGQAISASLFDFGLFVLHNAGVLAQQQRGPFLYLPKLQGHAEAALWESVLAHAENVLGLVPGSIKVTVLIETLPAAFEMDEILWELRQRIVGLNCGRWDYIFSCIKTLRGQRDFVLPERGQVGMTVPFLKAYSELLIQTCHRRGAFAMGGMAAQIPINTDAEANATALARVRADKQREAEAGHDGTWVAHPALIPVARAEFDRIMPRANQLDRLREDVRVTAADLLAPPAGGITRAGFINNIDVCVRYLAAWLDGLGCVPIHHLMEDAATAEISRAQLWQWLHRGDLCLDDGTPINRELFDGLLAETTSRLPRSGLPGQDRIDEAIAMLGEFTRASELADFLTLKAYQRLP